jgi:MOSC domain-containing protein YiiM
MPVIQSVNVGHARPIGTKTGITGIDKRPTQDPVKVVKPQVKGESGAEGDTICDQRHHGGPDQALYAYAREDLDWWEERLNVQLPSGVFGENLTTSRLDVSGARIGEIWRAGDTLLQVTMPRIPCATFAAWMAIPEWAKNFARAGRPGTYLRVIQGGHLRTGDQITVESSPSEHDVSVSQVFRAVTFEPDLLKTLLPAVDYLADDVLERIRRREVFVLSDTED